MPTAYIYEKLSISRFRGGVIGGYLDNYVDWLKDGGYSPDTIVSYLISAERFLEWMKMSGNKQSSLDDRTVADYRAVLRKHKSVDYYDGGNLYCGARRLVIFLRSTGKIPVEICSEQPLLKEFRSWMNEQRGTAVSTLEIYSRQLRRFLKAVGYRPEEYDARQLRQFVLSNAESTPSTHSMGTESGDLHRQISHHYSCPLEILLASRHVDERLMPILTRLG